MGEANGAASVAASVAERPADASMLGFGPPPAGVTSSPAPAPAARVHEVLPFGATADAPLSDMLQRVPAPATGTSGGSSTSSSLDGTEVVSLAPDQVVLPGLPGAVPASQLASIAARLPQIPPNMIRDVSFDQLPPRGTVQREQVEAAIDWYFQQMSIATSALNAAADNAAARPPAAAPPIVRNVLESTPVPPLVTQVSNVSAMSDAPSIDSSHTSVVELAASLDVPKFKAARTGVEALNSP